MTTKTSDAPAASGSAGIELPAALLPVSMVGLDTVLAAFRLKAASVIYAWIQDGLMPPPIQLSSRCSRWRIAEVYAIAAARAAGKSESDLRQLVAELCVQRQRLSADVVAITT